MMMRHPIESRIALHREASIQFRRQAELQHRRADLHEAYADFLAAWDRQKTAGDAVSGNCSPAERSFATFLEIHEEYRRLLDSGVDVTPLMRKHGVSKNYFLHIEGTIPPTGPARMKTPPRQVGFIRGDALAAFVAVFMVAGLLLFAGYAAVECPTPLEALQTERRSHAQTIKQLHRERAESAQKIDTLCRDAKLRSISLPVACL